MSTVTVESAPEQGGTEDSGRPLRADARRNRERVLAAATEVFAEQGADASVAEIARRAGVGAGTLFRHFPTKHDLLLATFQASLAARRSRRADRVARSAIDRLRASLEGALPLDDDAGDGWNSGRVGQRIFRAIASMRGLCPSGGC